MKSVVKFIVVSLVLVLSACGGNSGSGSSDNPLIGKWEITEAQGTMSDLNMGTVYNFVDETNLEVSKGGFTNKLTYTVSGDTINSTVGSVTMQATYKIEGGSMVYTILNSDQVFTMTKK